MNELQQRSAWFFNQSTMYDSDARWIGLVGCSWARSRKMYFLSKLPSLLLLSCLMNYVCRVLALLLASLFFFFFFFFFLLATLGFVIVCAFLLWGNSNQPATDCYSCLIQLSFPPTLSPLSFSQSITHFPLVFLSLSSLPLVCCFFALRSRRGCPKICV